MHRAGVDRGRIGRRFSLVGCEVALRIGFEFRLAAARAEIKGLTQMSRLVLGRLRIHSHAAYRIFHPVGERRCGCRIARAAGMCGFMMAVIMMGMAVTSMGAVVFFFGHECSCKNTPGGYNEA